MQKKRVIFILLMFFLLLNCVSCQKKYVTNLNHLEKKPTIDFLQPWNFCQYKLVEMNIHFMKLKEFGIDTVIFKMLQILIKVKWKSVTMILQHLLKLNMLIF